MSDIVFQGKATDVATLELLNPADLFKAGGTDAVYEAIKKEVSGIVPDIATEAGRKEVASLAYKVAQSKNFLDKIGKTFNADLKAKTKAVDEERRSIWDKLEALQKEIRAPLTEWEEAEKARVDAHKEAMTEFESLSTFEGVATIEQIDAAIKRGGELKLRDWQEFTEMAQPVFEAQLGKLTLMKSAAEQAEKDRLELEELRRMKEEQEAKAAEEARQKAAEEERRRIEQEAKEKAEREAAERIREAEEEAARQKSEAEQKAARDAAEAERKIKEAEEARIAAEAKAKLEAEQAVQRERERAAAEQKRIEDEAKARENNMSHHAKINNDVLACVKAVIESSQGKDTAKLLVEEMARGKIQHVKIIY